MPTAPDLSIIVPVFNRDEIIRYTFESVRRASAGLAVELIVVDDGSHSPVAETLARLGYVPTRLLRQENKGLLFARLAGFARATGRYTLFLDSDDLVSSDKLRAQLAAMDAEGAEVSYTDTARCVLDGGYENLQITADAPCAATADSAEFFISVQPAPHSPIFRTEYLRRVVAGAIFPPSALYNPVAEIWFYHVAAPLPARVVKVPGAHTIGGIHPGVRLTNHWERLAVASLAVMEAFARHCPTATPTERHARQLVGEKAFRSWRRLPRDFSREFSERQLRIWDRLAGDTPMERLGGRYFRGLARILGPVGAGRLMRRRNGTYAGCRTIDDVALHELLGSLPTP